MILHGIEYQRPTSLNMRILADHVTYSFLAFPKSIFHFCLGCYCGGYSQNERSNLSSFHYFLHNHSFCLHCSNRPDVMHDKHWRGAQMAMGMGCGSIFGAMCLTGDLMAREDGMVILTFHWVIDIILWNCSQGRHDECIGSGNGLSPDGTKPLIEPMLTEFNMFIDCLHMAS